MVKDPLIEIIIHEDKCTGCLTCQLWCSYTKTQRFNPTEARIQIENAHGLTPKISFLSDCIHCGQCAKHCLYGALEVK